MTTEKKSTKLLAVEAAWYAAEEKLQMAARKAAAEFLADEGRLNSGLDGRRGWSGRALQTVASDFAKADAALRVVLEEEASHD